MFNRFQPESHFDLRDTASREMRIFNGELCPLAPVFELLKSLVGRWNRICNPPLGLSWTAIAGIDNHGERRQSGAPIYAWACVAGEHLISACDSRAS